MYSKFWQFTTFGRFQLQRYCDTMRRIEETTLNNTEFITHLRLDSRTDE